MPVTGLIMQAIRNGGALQAAPAAPVTLVDHTIGFGSGGTTPRSPNTVEINGGDTTLTTRNGLTFQVIGTQANSGGASSGGSDGRFKTEVNGNGTITLVLPDGTYTVRAAMSVGFTTSTPAIRIRRASDSALLHSIAPTSTAAGNALDITGVDRALASWDATNASVSLVVSGGAGVIVDRGTIATQFFLNYMRWQQTA
jgi:hypothetical protein